MNGERQRESKVTQSRIRWQIFIPDHFAAGKKSCFAFGVCARDKEDVIAAVLSRLDVEEEEEHTCEEDDTF